MQVHSIGICGSDLHAYRGHHPFVSYPRVLGHELGGEVIEVGPNPRGLRAGDRVCVEPILNCGRCFPCRQGRYNCCTSIRVLGIHTDGGMTERIAVPIERLHKSPDDLSHDELALCETLSIGVQAVKRGEVQSGESVLILGGGPIGLGALIAARARGARTIVSDPIASNREAAERMGADAVVDPSSSDFSRRVRELTGEQGGAHVVLEAVGIPATIVQAIDLAAPTGRVVVIGVCKDTVPLAVSELMRKEVELRTTRNSCEAFPAVLELFRSYRDELRRMITHHFPLDDGPRVFSWFHESRGGAGVIKAILHVQ
jgi:2-desacetyl-2-hydroxyethyl bacteriochlorophyllide A dehydrogenase